jgi:hypothetical protein
MRKIKKLNLASLQDALHTSRGGNQRCSGEGRVDEQWRGRHRPLAVAANLTYLLLFISTSKLGSAFVGNYKNTNGGLYTKENRLALSKRVLSNPKHSQSVRDGAQLSLSVSASCSSWDLVARKLR